MAVTINADTTNGLVITPDTSGDLSFQSSGSNIFTIDSSGNTVFSGALSWSGDLAVDTNTLYVDATNNRVGIGTTSPASLLHIDQGSGGEGLRFERDTYDTVDIELSESGLRFRNETDGRTDLFLAGDGNVGVGRSSPVTKLDVDGSTTFRGRVNIPSGISNGAGESSLVVEDGANTGEEGGVEIRAFAPRLLLVDRSTGSYTVNMVMDGVNFTWYQNTDANRYTTKGTERFRYGITSGNAYNTTGTWGTISDQNLKENVVDATPKLDEVKQLQVRNFNLIDEDLKQIGFVAQEIEQVFPNIVDTQVNEEDGTETKYVKTTVLIPILTKALQEAITKIEDLETRIQALENA